jgi:cysteinyl-tRNA synthetase
MHNAFLTLGGEKVSKSIGNVVYVCDLIEKGFHPLALRYFFLQAHYSTPLSFSWEALAGAAGGLDRLWKIAREVEKESGKKGMPSEMRELFLATIRDDLSTPHALGILWDTVQNDDFSPEEKWGLLESAEAHLGLDLTSPPKEKHSKSPVSVPEPVRALVSKRETARSEKDFEEADRLRTEIENCGYHVDDSPEGPVLSRETL